MEGREGKDNGDLGAQLLVGTEVRRFVKYQITKGIMGHYMGYILFSMLYKNTERTEGEKKEQLTVAAQ